MLTEVKCKSLALRKTHIIPLSSAISRFADGVNASRSWKRTLPVWSRVIQATPKIAISPVHMNVALNYT
ncbi:hypothetical protein DY000_02047656 [Brassica cretica]|uniref:Uncharacterized protein n=1 Tax=Brassica cretica TaxID=69181 RepID=A0ABQ7ENS8_BRACR|nr:hypothetical protein DY000_02047656 [Brassica cretica]